MAHRISPEEYQELGRRHYKLKQYEKAVEAFTHGLDIAPTLSLFDHRAVAYDKLEDYNAAVKDGRDMIKLDKQDVKGYLRTASILEKMKKPETALGIYKYGMKNVPVSDKNFKLLQQLHDKITRKLSPAKSVDPLTVLPVELAEMVLEHLAFRHQVNCMRVSRGWRDYIAKLPRLWMHLDLSGARRPVPRKFVDKAARHSEYRLTRVTIHRFEHVDMLKNLAKACKDLTELEFISLPHAMSSTLVDIVQCAPKLEKFVVHPQITTGTATQILNSRRALKHVGFNAIKESQWPASWDGPFADLETCNMHFEHTTTRNSGSLEALLNHTLKLKTLNISQSFVSPGFLKHVVPTTHSASWLPLTTLIMRKIQFHAFPMFPPTLQKLVIEYNGSFELRHAASSAMHRDPTLLQSRLPALTHLALSDINMLSAERMEDFLDMYLDIDDQAAQLDHLDDAAPLQSLSIRGVVDTAASNHGGLFQSKRDSLFSLSPRILTPALQHLDIATLPVNDDDIEHLLRHKTGLESIDISYTNITGASIKMLVDGLPRLKTIKADNCPRISGRDAIEYAIRKGVVINCSMGEGKGSRKVRYG